MYEDKPILGAKMIDKNAKFVDLANKRVRRAIKLIQLISNLSGNNYTYTDDQAEQIVRALEKEVKSLRHSFMNQNGKESKEFALK